MSELEELRSEFERIEQRKLEIGPRLEELKENELVKEYIELFSENLKLNVDLREIETEIEKKKMMNCLHIFINGGVERVWDGHRTDIHKYPFCMKCGLNSRFIDWEYVELLSPLERLMSNIYLKTRRKGLYWDYYCKPSLAMEIYKKIKQAFPDASDEEILEHFKVEIGIREKKKIR